MCVWLQEFVGLRAFTPARAYEFGLGIALNSAAYVSFLDEFELNGYSTTTYRMNSLPLL